MLALDVLPSIQSKRSSMGLLAPNMMSPLHDGSIGYTMPTKHSMRYASYN